MTNVTISTTVLPDAFVGVPYVCGLPVTYVTSNTPTAASVSGAPNGLAVNSNALLSGTVIPASSTASQVDGTYTLTVTVSDGGGHTGSGTLTLNVHYLQGDQDLTPAEQAALRNEPFVATNVADSSNFSQTIVTSDAG